MAMEILMFQLKETMRVNVQIDKKMEKEHFAGMMGLFIVENGKMTKCVGKVPIQALMV